MAVAARVEPYPWSEEVIDVHIPRIDRSYQREPKQDLINRIGQGYDLALAGYLTMNRRRDGQLFVLDGQQRLLGAQKAGEVEVLARVFANLAFEEEAHLYEALNQTKPLNASEKFKGAYAAGRPDVLKIYMIVHSFGASIMGVDGHQMDSISAVSALQDVYRAGGEWGLTTVLSLINRAFGEVTRTTTPSAFMKALYMAVSRHHEEIDQKRLADRIAVTGLLALKQQALAFASRNADASGYYVALLSAYNHKLSEKKRLSPIFRGEIIEDNSNGDAAA